MSKYKVKVKFDPEKLQEVCDILSRVEQSGPGGEFMTHLHISPSLTWGDISFQLFWKCENGSLSFKNLDEALDQARKIEMWAADRQTMRRR